MRKRLIVCSCMILLLIVIFLPITTTYSFSSDVKTLTSSEEKLGYCELSLEIKDVHSLLYCYKKSFSFVLDGNISPEPVNNVHHETDSGTCFITQMYYDKDKNRLDSCGLFYQDDLLHFVLYFNEKQYIFETTA